MGVDKLMPDEEEDAIIEDSISITIQDLINQYGEARVRRGISYMLSLDKAEQNWKESATESSNYGKRYIESFTSSEADEAQASDVNSDWLEGMEDGGLGLNE